MARLGSLWTTLHVYSCWSSRHSKYYQKQGTRMIYCKYLGRGSGKYGFNNDLARLNSVKPNSLPVTRLIVRADTLFAASVIA